MKKNNISYAELTTELEDFIDTSINKFYDKGAEKEDILIYMCPVIQAFWYQELLSQKQDKNYAENGWIEEYKGLQVIDGYEENMVIVGWRLGPKFNIKPFKIKLEYEH